MNTPEFNVSMNKLINEATSILSSAEKEYATDADRLSNFKSIPGVDPELVCFIYLGKHIDGIRNYVTGRARNQRDSIRGRIHDALNYLILLNAIIEEKDAKATGLAIDLMFGDDERILSTQMMCPTHNTSLYRTKDNPAWRCIMCEEADRRVNIVSSQFNEDK